ncbi:hypothetical protein DFQ27_003760 [Actinomortierella ambigua]|uniref:Elongation of fatty acids protein n=1 Tax=Actinomortierella ambigua TaxID=1343610 RepID=A0A9P6Q728_9FUNG|nr:hypothetical protein DFQ27_003760 [Actinomortierella ambigua]
MELLKQIATDVFRLNLDSDRRMFLGSEDWPVAPMPEGIVYPEYFDALVNWRTPLVIAALYVLMVVLLNPKEGKVSRVVAASSGKASQGKQLSKSSPAMTALVFVHNLILCIYSAWTFRGMFIAWSTAFKTHSFMEAVCDSDDTFWAYLGYYSYYFYLSKYYEIVDTIIILLKGRRSSLLQTYHHAGAIITMWFGFNFQAHPIWIFTTFNSFIHTIMYAYYAATAIGLKPPGKKYLTSMQITQFWTGIVTAMWYQLFAPKGCFENEGERFAIWTVMAYVVPLIYLFVAFARSMYGGAKRSAPGTTKSGKVASKEE